MSTQEDGRGFPVSGSIVDGWVGALATNSETISLSIRCPPVPSYRERRRTSKRVFTLLPTDLTGGYDDHLDRVLELSELYPVVHVVEGSA